MLGSNLSKLQLALVLSSFAVMSSIYANELQFDLMLDKNLSAMTGAQFLDSSLELYQVLRDKTLPATVGQNDFINGAYRGTRFVLEDYLARFTMVAQHEIFGHGARIRSLHGVVTGYYVSPMHGWTRYYEPASLPLGLKASIIAGGVEGTRVLSQVWRRRFVREQMLTPTQGHFYLWSALDQTDYTLRTFHRSSRGDISRYISTINALHQEPVLSLERLKTLSLTDLADPYLYFSLISLWHYLGWGRELYNYPMLNVGDYHYVGGLGLILAPYGPEVQLWNFIRTPQHDFEFSLRRGQTNQVKTWGLALQTDMWQVKNQSVSLNAELWGQPDVASQTFDPKNRLGGLLGLTFEQTVFTNCRFLTEVAYKTAGFTTSQAYKSGVIFRVGLRLSA